MKNELTVTVDCKLNVDDSTVGGCLKLVEIYMNQHPGVSLNQDTRSDGTTVLWLGAPEGKT